LFEEEIFLRRAECADINVEAAAGVEDMFVRGSEDLIPFVEFGRWCWLAVVPRDSVALDVFEVELCPERSVVAESPQKILIGGPVRSWLELSVGEDVVNVTGRFVP
jgi:hypothetical protein